MATDMDMAMGMATTKKNKSLGAGSEDSDV